VQSVSFAAFRALGDELLSAVKNVNTRAVYRTGIESFLNWWEKAGTGFLNRDLVQAHLWNLADSGLSANTINQRLTAVRRFAGLAVNAGLIDLSTAADIARVSSIRRSTKPHQLTLVVAQSEALVNAPSPLTTKGTRDRALLAMLIGCGLRRSELVNLRVENVLTQGHQWHLAGVVGPRGRVRSVAVPGWVKEALNTWLQRARFSRGPLFRPIDREGAIRDRVMSPQTVRAVVAEYARLIGLEATPEDLRRTCARLCRDQGGELHQIQMMLGHASIESTERLLGRHEVAGQAPNMLVRMKWYRSSKVAS